MKWIGLRKALARLRLMRKTEARTIHSYPRRHGKAGWKATISLDDLPTQIEPSAGDTMTLPDGTKYTAYEDFAGEVFFTPDDD